MSKNLSLKAVLTIGGLALAGVFASTGTTLAQGTWCAEGGGRSGYSNCGFRSFRQCMASVRGVGGTCKPNPAVETYEVSEGNGYYRVYRRYYY